MTTSPRQVAITGIGILSCLGNTPAAVSAALRAGRSGIVAMPRWRERGMGSQVAARVHREDDAAMPPFSRRYERFMGDTARFACHAARLALDDARLDAAALHSPRAGVVIGSGSGTLQVYDDAMALVAARGIERAPPFIVPQVMGNTACASVAQVFGVQGISYAVSAACTTSTIALGQAAHLIASGAQDVMLAGGSEALHDNTALMFDAMGTLSRGFNATPHTASRPYDRARDGFVIGEGAGVLVLESLDHAVARGANVIALLDGYGQSTDPGSFVSPGARGIARAVAAAWRAAGQAPIDYINTHAPSTPQGDLAETDALRQVFGGAAGMPAFSSTKAFSGHALGACGVHEAIYTLLMMRDGFIAGGIGTDAAQTTPTDGSALQRDPVFADLPMVERTRDARLTRTMSVSFGFGGSCAALCFAARDTVAPSPLSDGSALPPASAELQKIRGPVNAPRPKKAP
ncbi:beta-ketoacyl-[acyl-carrier-protein] synthase family protein [Robbsia sp. KACC 23696]|uniref:beta-ketoacyl-[acyl-carrier-protein] synthase family protein n=1 Tax=Robbsia sp. KACC 23696 TaxID=3149231 RepID=UPI00325A72C1